MRSDRARRFLQLGCLLLMTNTDLHSQTPNANAILDRYTATVDPSGLLSSLRSARMRMRSAIAETEFVTEMRLTYLAPDRVRIVVGVGGVGETEMGFDGTTGWMIEMDGAARAATPQELRQLRQGESLRTFGRPLALFSRAEIASSTKSDFDVVDCLRLSWRSGLENVECYSRKTGLLVESVSEEGAMSATTRYLDYRVVGGLLLPHQLESIVAGQEASTTSRSTIAYDFSPVEASEIQAPKSLRPDR